MVPSGKVGVDFVLELARLFKAYSENTILEKVALKCTMVSPALMLQKPPIHSKVKDHIAHLQQCLKLWKEGNISALVHEGLTIQRRLNHTNTSIQKSVIRRVC